MHFFLPNPGSREQGWGEPHLPGGIRGKEEPHVRLLTLQVQKIRKYFKELFKFLIILQDGSSLRQSEGQRRLKKIWRERES